MAVLYRHIRLDSNQPFYIGIGQDEKRAYSKKGRNKHWQGVVNKHGYKVQIMLDELTWEEAQQKEIEFIKLYGRVDLGLGTLVNMTDGGDGTLGHICSEEARVKLSAAGKGRVITEEWKAKLSVANKGKLKGRKLSEEHVAKVSAANTGKKCSEETKAKLSSALTGKKHSAETKAKLSAALTGRKLSEEHIAKVSAAATGRKQSEETKAKRAATRRANGNHWCSEETRTKMRAAQKARRAKKRMENG